MTTNNHIHVQDIVIPPTQRRLRPWKVAHIAAKIQERGYNESYPITLEPDERTLIDGGHRIAAAKMVSIDNLPYVTTDADPVMHAIRANEDGTDTEAHDVFDLAELCWRLSEEGMTGAEIAPKLGWSSAAMVTYHKNVKELLHSKAFDLATNALTKNGDSVNDEDDGLVKDELTRVKWTERHLREIVSAIPAQDNATYRAQLRVIRACIARVNEKDKRFGQVQKRITAKWIKGVAGEQAWYVRLGKHMRDNLVERVPIRDRVDLLRSVYAGVYGKKDDETSFQKFDDAIGRLNEKVLGVILYHDDALQCIPALEDKSIALVVTDPPYNVTDEDWDQVGTDEEYIQFTIQWLESLRPKLADDYHVFFFCDPDYAARLETETLQGWPLQSRIIWSNRSLPSGRQPRGRFARTWQMVFHLGTHSLNWPQEWSDAQFDIQVYAAPNANTKDGGYHPTPKPQALIEHLVRIGSKPTDLVVDPFAGGGTTGAACAEIRQRRCILIEKEEQFCEAIERRLQIRREH